MRAGKLKHRVLIEKPTEEKNSFGEITTTWSTHVTRWAQVEQLTGAEYWTAKQINDKDIVRFYVRYASGVTHKMRIKYNDNYYYITSIADWDGAKRKLEIVTERNP